MAVITIWARRANRDEETLFLAIGGCLIIILTILRPWWFWRHPKAAWLRGLIGDGPTTLFYLGIAGTFLYMAYARHHQIQAIIRDCESRLATAPDAHARLRVLAEAPDTLLPKSGPKEHLALSCGRFRERGWVSP
jgi:hypothetical protein